MLFNLVLTLLGLGFVSAQTCKVLPGDPDWPTEQEWAALNQTVSGHLIDYSPPGAVCARSTGLYNSSACSRVRSSYGSQELSNTDPAMIRHVFYTGNTCTPSTSASMTCTQGNFPDYVLRPANAEDISTVVKFAAERNIRVVVKNSGHDFMGRSIGKGLSIWMRGFEGFTHHDAFTTECEGDTPQVAATLSGGIQFSKVYAAAAAKNRVILGGSSGTVGPVGGYIPGGGHSAFSGAYGLAVDQVLEFKVVKPDGTITKVNRCTESDLWWALRGGGAGTYAIVTDVTVKTYPIPEKFASGSLTISTTSFFGRADAWWELISATNSFLPTLADAGISGYYYTLASLKIFTFSFYRPGMSPAEVDAVFAPLREKLRALDGASVSFSYSSSSMNYQSWVNAYASEGGGLLGSSTVEGTLMSSRLIPREAMEKDPAAFKAALRAAYDGISGGLLGHLVGGGKVSENRDLDMGLNPAWRIAISHMIVMDTLSTGTSPTEWERRRQALSNKVAALRTLSPNGGSYHNECDVKEPNKYQAFFGANAPRLLEIKRQVDPTGLLYCGNCIGSDDWTMADGRLCRVV